MDRKKIAIVGVGLMGGSLALRLHEKKLASHIIGVDENKKHANEAMDLELVDEILSLEKAIKKTDIIFLCLPVDAIINLLPKILDLIKNQIVVDLGSTKKQIIDSVKDHQNRGRLVATHPMWGTEYSGPKAAVKGAYEGKAVIICDESNTDKDALEWTKAMYKKIGMHLLSMEAAAHDLHVAYISHISHITSFALANTVLQKEQEEQTIFELASSGFESTVRLAKSNPEMWLPIFMQNRENVLDVLDEHIDQLKKFRNSLSNNSHEEIRVLMEMANKIGRIIR